MSCCATPSLFPAFGWACCSSRWWGLLYDLLFPLYFGAVAGLRFTTPEAAAPTADYRLK